MAPFRNAEIVPLSEVPAEFPESKGKLGHRGAVEPIVMVVDDEPLVADTLATILSRAGYTVVKSYCGLKALELARITRPALLISDVAMPEMNGVELAMAVLSGSPDCGVLLFSGHATAKDLAPAHEAGYDFTLLMKPLHPEEMLKHVSKALRGAKTMMGHLGMAAVPDALA